MFADKVLLITGGTGSFGNAVINRFLHTDVAEIRIFSRDEKKQSDMRAAIHNDKVKYYIGDVRDPGSVENAMRGVDYVFHAAALKQVPSCEFYPMQAVYTNIIGTEHVLDAAVRNGVSRVIALSTDKAAYPINAMGISKAMMEKLVAAKARVLTGGEAILCSTRYGNVMASRGSVIPHFVEQIKQGKPITITDPNMTRFMMSLEDAVELVLFAYEHGSQGDLFVQKAPAATVGMLAEALKKIFKADNEIRIIGTRHGEKLHETLMSREERIRSDDMGGYYRIQLDARDLNYGLYFEEGDEKITACEDYTSENTDRLTEPELIEMLLKLDFIQQELEGPDLR